MDDEKIRAQVLTLLAQKYGAAGQAGFMYTADIAQQLGVDVELLKGVLAAMHDLHLIKGDVGMGSVHMLDAGFRAARPRDVVFPPTADNRQIHFNAPIQSSAIAFDQASASVSNQQVTLLQSLAKAVQDCPEIEPGQRQHWAKTLWEMSKHPALVALLGSLG